MHKLTNVEAQRVIAVMEVSSSCEGMTRYRRVVVVLTRGNTLQSNSQPLTW